MCLRSRRPGLLVLQAPWLDCPRRHAHCALKSNAFRLGASGDGKSCLNFLEKTRLRPGFLRMQTLMIPHRRTGRDVVVDLRSVFRDALPVTRKLLRRAAKMLHGGGSRPAEQRYPGHRSTRKALAARSSWRGRQVRFCSSPCPMPPVGLGMKQGHRIGGQSPRYRRRTCALTGPGCGWRSPPPLSGRSSVHSVA